MCGRRVAHDEVQVKFCAETAPFVVGDENGQLTTKTVVRCTTRIVADVNATSVMVCVHLGLGQPGAPGIGLSGAPVESPNRTVPFLISEEGMLCVPVSVTSAGFWPGGCVAPAG